MKTPALFLSILTAAALAVPAFAADDGIIGLQWGRNSKDFDGMPSGPQPLSNLNRLPNGTANDRQLIGDYRNPILTPYAAAIVKQKGEQAKAGGFPNSQDQCRPIAPPFTFAIQFDFQILQNRDGNLTIIYHDNDQVRHVRMNGTHPAKLVPTTMGDSVGHWDGDVLVVDTVGVKVNPDFTTVDRFGTPQSEGMHVVERYRLLDNGNTLEIVARVEDPGAFTTPWSAVQRYKRVKRPALAEDICAENNSNYLNEDVRPIPTAAKPDF